MPFNGSGTFSIVNSFVPNTTILSSAVNANFSDIATGLSDCLTRDGQAGMTAAFKAISGSIGAPSITFSSDATSGLYLAASGIPSLIAHSLGLNVNSSVYQAQSATVQAGGSNYVAGDTITETGGTFTTPAVFTVATLSGSAVATVTATVPGIYTTKPSNPVAQGSTSGVGSGCTLNITWNDPGASDYRVAILDQANGAIWEKLGASSFVKGLMGLANGLDFVNALGASNVAAATGLSAPPPGSSFKNLAIKVTTNTALTAAADFVVTTNGTKYLTTALSSTINMATTGANALDAGSIASATWYAIWAIAKSDGTTAGLASTSFTSPTMPSGYTYKARIGAVRTAAGSAQLMGTWQLGRKAQYVASLAQTTAPVSMIIGNSGNPIGTPPTWTSVAVTNYVPPTAAIIRLYIFANANTGTSIIAAPNNTYGNNIGASGGPPPLSFTGGSTNAGSTAADLTLEGSNVYYAAAVNSPGGLYCFGWEDNL